MLRSECKKCQSLGLIPIKGTEVVKRCDCIPFTIDKIDTRPWWVREEESEYRYMMDKRGKERHRMENVNARE